MSYTSTLSLLKSTRRKLDPRRPVPVYRPGEVNDADAIPVGLDVGTGVDKDEEREVHLQNYMQAYAATASAASVDIPVPDANQRIPDSDYATLYPIKIPAPSPNRPCSSSVSSPPTSTPNSSFNFDPSTSTTTSSNMPSTLIRFSTALEDLPAGTAYNLDEDDDVWLSSFRPKYEKLFPSLIIDLYPCQPTTTCSPPPPGSPRSLSPPRKRVRRGTSVSPSKSSLSPRIGTSNNNNNNNNKISDLITSSSTPSSSDNNAPSDNRRPPPLVPISDDAFELVMHLLEVTMNDHVQYYLSDAGHDTELSLSDRPSIEQALDMLRSRPDSIGPQPTSFSLMSYNSTPSLRSNVVAPRSPLLRSASTPGSQSLDSTTTATTSIHSNTPLTTSVSIKSSSNSYSSRALPPGPNDPPTSQVEWWLPYVYDWWNERRARQNNRPIVPTVRIEEPSARNESDPYACFRRREIKLVRKTRRSDAQALIQLKKLRSELALVRGLIGLVLNRELSSLHKVQLDRSIFNARLNLRQVKCQHGIQEELEMERPEFSLPIIPTPKPVPTTSISKLITPKNPNITPTLSGAAAASRANKLARIAAAAATASGSNSSTSNTNGTSRTGSVTNINAPMGPKPYMDLRQVDKYDKSRDIPSISEIQSHRIDERYKEQLAHDHGRIDVSLTPHAIFHPMLPVRVPGGSVTDTSPSTTTIPTSTSSSSLSSTTTSIPSLTLSNVAIPPLAWRMLSPRAPPAYQLPAGVYHGLCHSQIRPGSQRSFPFTTLPTSNYPSLMLASAMANGMYHPGLAAAVAGISVSPPNQGTRFGSVTPTDGTGTPPTPPGTPPTGHVPGVSGTTGINNGQSPHAWLATMPPHIRRALIYPYAAQAAAAAATVPSVHAQKLTIPDSALTNGTRDLFFSSTGSHPVSGKQKPCGSRRPKDGGNTWSTDHDSDTIMDNTCDPSTSSPVIKEVRTSISTPSPSPDLSIPVSFPMTSTATASSSSSFSLSHPNFSSVMVENDSKFPVPLSPTSVSDEHLLCHHPTHEINQSFLHTDVLSSTTSSHSTSMFAPGTSTWPPGINPSTVFASLFDFTSPVAAKLASAATSAATTVTNTSSSSSLPSCNQHCIKPNNTTINNHTSTNNNTPTTTSSAQWAYRRRVGRSGRILVERRWVTTTPSRSTGPVTRTTGILSTTNFPSITVVGGNGTTKVN